MLPPPEKGEGWGGGLLKLTPTRSLTLATSPFQGEMEFAARVSSHSPVVSRFAGGMNSARIAAVSAPSAGTAP